MKKISGKLDLSETELLNQLKQNCKDYGQVLFSTYYKTIYNIAYRMTGNKEDAEDILQDVFYYAFQNIKNFRGDSKISTWLYTITRNAFLKQFKKTSRSSFTTLNNLIHTAMESKEIDELNSFEKNFYIAQIKEGCLLGLIRCLTFNQRISFILSVLYEVELKDVALIVNKTENATRILIHRAKQNIKKFLCENCSLYDSANSCHCEYLINFSLKNKWIKKYSSTLKRKNITSEKVENDLKEFKKIVYLYSSLPKHCPPQVLVQQIKSEIRNDKYSIFF